ncbi:alkaline phosphatase family protein [Sphingomonas hankyongi]|uniref:Alkaline phosphatase n=1 Tax=Sphingomonas hankyongi TaxID=2908209 RepID=A0ABT0S362_9SPHN|nr:alkaline phosphatase family protein [Sphingomonas hankyongi]MCL6730292.1 alkaline phosphatase family protein [Sphingomonas hankyongi]
MRKLVLAAAAAFIPTVAWAQSVAQPVSATAPKLTIVISVDQLSADLWNEYRPQFAGGFARLASGTVFRNGYQSHAGTETCPGHATILTGVRSGRAGIPINNWFDFTVSRADKAVYCAEDETVPGSSSDAYTVSARHLKVPTLGEYLKAAMPGSRSVAVAGKDRAAVMMGGHNVDQRWFFKAKMFQTDLQDVAVPASVARANAAVSAQIARAQPGLEPPPFCASKAKSYVLGGRPDSLKGEPRTVGLGRFDRAAGDANAFSNSPEYDGAVLALAAALIGEMQLGRGPSPDLLSIGLSATDYVGHRFGTEGQEMCLQLLSLDRDLGDFFGVLDRSGIDYAVALTADHGSFDIPERAKERLADAAYVDVALDASDVGKAIGDKLGIKGPVLFGEWAGDIWINGALSPADRRRVMDEALRIYRAHPQVEAVFTKDEIARTPVPVVSPDKWTLVQRARASFDPQRSGDLWVVLKEHVSPYPSTPALASTHGTPWDHDRRVPIVFWRAGMSGSLREEAVETVDIMPTLAAMLGLRITSEKIDGHCLPDSGLISCPPR